MKKIGLISDTHGFIDDELFNHFKDVDEIWHAGDIGDIEVLNKLKHFKPLRVVFGNIDSNELRYETVEDLFFTIENVKVFITHIGGYPLRYARNIKQKLIDNDVKLFICGHSHILKVIYDKELDLLHLNPGAYGKSGFHKIRTAMRFIIDNDKIKSLEIIELKKF